MPAISLSLDLQCAVLVINPATVRSARSSVRTADPTDRRLTLGSAVRTIRGFFNND